MNEITSLVASEPNRSAAGRLVEMWVKSTLNEWYTCFPGRKRHHDDSIRLLVWDVIGTALANVDWHVLVAMVAGETVTHENLFTWTLYRCVLNDSQLLQAVQAFMQEASNAYAGADALEAWFQEQVDVWVNSSAACRQRNLPLSVLVYSLIQNTYTTIFWEHVAEAFRSGY